jgi:ABC-type sugar transport system ATPase subunit
MTREAYLKALKKLGLSHVGAGRVLGISGRQAQRIASGHNPVPKPVALLLRCYLEHGLPKIIAGRG